MTRRVLVLDADGGLALPIVEGAGTARAIVWPGMGAELRALHRITLSPGARTIEMRHEGEAVYFVRSGAATVEDGDAGSSHVVASGRMFFVDPGTRYAIVAADGPVEVVGGPAPPDPSLYEGAA